MSTNGDNAEAKPRDTLTVVTGTKDLSDELRRVLLTGDLSRLTDDQKLNYYKQICDTCGLNPATRPFEFILFKTKQILYATKNAGEQLRKIHGISVRVTKTEQLGSVYVVAVEATDAKGRMDSSTGAVFTDGLRGEELANALMRAETKAKRRVALSICGLGMLDETEIETVVPKNNAHHMAFADPSFDQTIDVKAGRRAPAAPMTEIEHIQHYEQMDAAVLPREPASSSEGETAHKSSSSSSSSRPGLIMARPEPGDYIIRFGKKFKDRPIKDFPVDELLNWARWIRSESEKNAKPLGSQAVEAFQMIEKYAASIKSLNAPKTNSNDMEINF